MIQIFWYDWMAALIAAIIALILYKLGLATVFSIIFGVVGGVAGSFALEYFFKPERIVKNVFSCKHITTDDQGTFICPYCRRKNND